MAPNKKKKKPAANPARGFATTSVPSKQKVQAPPEPLTPKDSPQESPPAPENQSSQAPVNAPSGEGSRELHQVAAEDLEQYLEQAELHAIVEKYVSGCKNDALRQATKIEKERRMLRPQAQHLSVRNWLCPELVTRILEKEKVEADRRRSKYSVGGVDDHSEVSSEEEMCAKIWTLQQILSELGFPESRVHEVLKVVPAHLADDPIDEAFEWLGMHCNETELPSYGERKLPTIADTMQTSMLI
jgi:ATP-dependent RNA helicase DHX29